MFASVLLIIIATIYSTYSADSCGCSAKAIEPFDLNEYLGVWHQIVVNKRFEEIYERNYPLCVYANYSLFSNGTVSVINSGYNSKGDVSRAYGIATQPKQNTGQFMVSFYGSKPGPYNIIKMIYDDNNKYNIALVWSCDDGGLVQDLWILSRDYNISQSNYNELIGFAKSSGINVDNLGLMNTTQTNCKIGGWR